MEPDFIQPNQLEISCQIGMDGRRRSITISRWILPVIGLILLFLLFSTVYFYISMAAGASVSNRLERLQAENDKLRAKLEFYATAVDSIYIMLDSMQLKDLPKETDYPSLNPGASEEETGFSYDPQLERQIDNLEHKLAFILSTVSPALEQPLASLAEIPYGELPSETTPSIYPSFGRISDGWGLRVHPLTNQIEFHQGIDIANQMGTPVYATAAGTVVRLDFDTSYGKRIVINHNGTYQTLYAHLYSYQVRVGDAVSKGQIIGLMGSTGISTGPHLHYEVQTAAGKVNPSGYLNRIDDVLVASR